MARSRVPTAAVWSANAIIPKVFVHANPDGSFTVGRERGKNVEAFRANVYELIDLAWLIRRVIRESRPLPQDGEGGDEVAHAPGASAI